MNIADQIERAKREIASWPRWMQDAARQASANMEPSMDTAALSRYANPGADLGHAGPDAPIHADERIALADLPRLAESPQAASEGFRAALQQRDREQLERTNRLLRAALRAVLDEIEGPRRPYSADSYLPEHIVTACRRALTLGALL